MRLKPTLSRLTALAGLLGLMVVGGAAIAQESEHALVTVFHAVPAEDGFPADVYLNDQLVIDGFVFAASSDTFELDPGPAQLDIYPDGADPNTDSPAVSAAVTIEAGANYSVVAQISGGAPVISLFENDTTGVGAGEARLTFRQTSAADTLDVSVDGQDTFTAIASTNEASTELAAGQVTLTISNAGGTVFEGPLSISDGALTVVYAVGDPAGDEFDILVQEVVIPQVAPTEVPTGSGGDKAAGSVPFWLLLIPISIVAVGLVSRRRLE